MTDLRLLLRLLPPPYGFYPSIESYLVQVLSGSPSFANQLGRLGSRFGFEKAGSGADKARQGETRQKTRSGLRGVNEVQKLILKNRMQEKAYISNGYIWVASHLRNLEWPPLRWPPLRS
jgi:hypothetical protein